MKKRAFLGWLAGIPIIGKAFAQAAPQAPEAATIPTAPRQNPLDAWFIADAKRIKDEIHALIQKQHSEGRATSQRVTAWHPLEAQLVQSQRICFEDLSRYNATEQLKSIINNFIRVAASDAATNISCYPHVDICVEWQNIPNCDVTSEDFNPLSNWGRYVALISKSDTTPA